MAKRKSDPNDIAIVVSDMHCGCQVALCPPGVALDEGGTYQLSATQAAIWSWWQEFWGEWVPMATEGQPYHVVINGDALDNEHHGVKTLITNNLSTQRRIAAHVLDPVRDACEGRFYMVRGTAAHDGQSGQDVEALARELGAIPNAIGQHARPELWKWMGTREALVHYLHTIGTTGSASYESTAVHKEAVESFSEAARWGDRPPDVIVRSHRHRYFKTEVASARDRAFSVVTPGWQGKTGLLYRIAGARQSQPQFGGIMLRLSGERELYERHYVQRLSRPEAE